MGEITEKTKVGLTVGAAILAVLFLLRVGAWWGTMNSDRSHQAATLERHEEDIRDLRQTFTEMQRTLDSIRQKQESQENGINTAVRNSTFLVEKLGQIQVALAERGITVKGD